MRLDVRNYLLIVVLSTTCSALNTNSSYRPMSLRDYVVILLTLGVTGFCIWENYGG